MWDLVVVVLGLNSCGPALTALGHMESSWTKDRTLVS